jgi:hypothetical protein
MKRIVEPNQIVKAAPHNDMTLPGAYVVCGLLYFRLKDGSVISCNCIGEPYASQIKEATDYRRHPSEVRREERERTNALDEARYRRAERIHEKVCGRKGKIEYTCAILAAHEADTRAEERERIAKLVSERRVLRLQIDCDPVKEANEIIQDLAHDIATNWADFEDA